MIGNVPDAPVFSHAVEGNASGNAGPNTIYWVQPDCTVHVKNRGDSRYVEQRCGIVPIVLNKLL
jgi:hypothetical protein